MQGQLYTKYGKVIARKVTKTEEVITITSSGLETKNVAQKGDYIVTNISTKAKEKYVVLNEKFNSRYKKINTISKRIGLYKPLGTVQAIQVSKTILKILNRASTFYIMAAWGEKQMVKLGDYLACPVTEDEVYRIGYKEFMDTY